MEITSIRIFLNRNGEDSKVKGVAHMVMNNAIVMRRIHIVEDDNNPGVLHVVYPVYHLKAVPAMAEDDKGYRRCYYASDPENMERFNAAVLDAYNQVLADPEHNTVHLGPEDAPEIAFKVTDATIYPHLNDPTSNTLAKVNVELDNQLWLRGMFLMKRDDGTMFLRMPVRTNADGRRVNLYHPRTQAARDMLTDAVLPLYEAAVEAAEAEADADAVPDTDTLEDDGKIPT